MSIKDHNYEKLGWKVSTSYTKLFMGEKKRRKRKDVSTKQKRKSRGRKP